MISVKRPQLFLIDLDGTLVDSVPDLAYCVDEMMARLDLPQAGESRVREWVGNGVERLVKRALTGELEAEPEADLMARAYPVFLELYDVHNGENSRLYPGVREGLEWLKAEGFKLGCITNKAARFTEPLLKKLGVYDFFGTVISGDTLPVKKPDPAPLLHGAAFFGLTPEESIMLGDSVSDVKAARAAKFSRIICVSYGYNHGIPIEQAGPDQVIDSFMELSGLDLLNGVENTGGAA